MDSQELKEFAMYLKTKKYLGIIQKLKLEYNTDKKTPHIYLALIQIKKAYQHQGYGSLIMQDIIDFANVHEIEVWLYATNIYGSDLERLCDFYLKFGFVLYNKKDKRFKYKPKKILQLM
jgi:GNAT superfamily N-acetyltransferase